MTRRVFIELQDGSIQPVDDVPDNIQDDSVGKRYGGRVVPRGELITKDVIKSGASGLPFGASQLLTAPMKAGIGLGMKAGFENELAPFARTLQQNEAKMLSATGGDYVPMTKAGEYAKMGAASAIPIPGLGPIGLQAGLGALGGMASMAASDANLGTGASIAAGMAPYLVHGGYKALQPAKPSANTRAALNALRPEEQAAMQERMLIAKKNEIPLMPWQAAPEGSEFRRLGTQVANSSSSYPVRAIQGEQALTVTGNPNLPRPSPSITTTKGGALYEQAKSVPITPDKVEAIRKSILAIKEDKKLAPHTPQARLIDKMADQFGTYKQANPVAAMADAYDNLSKTRNLAPDHPDRVAAVAKFDQVKLGAVAPEFTTGGIDNYGQVLNIYQNPKMKGVGGAVDVDSVTKRWIRDAIAKVADVDNPYFPAARQNWRELSDIKNQVAATDRRTSGGLNVASEAKTELAPDIALAIGANPIWALVPPIRDWAARRSIAEYNKGFASTNIDDLLKLAYQSPRKDAAKSFAAAGLVPVKQGHVALSDMPNGQSEFSADFENRLRALYGLLGSPR